MESFVYDIDSIRGLNLNIKVPLPLFTYLVSSCCEIKLGWGGLQIFDQRVQLILPVSFWIGFVLWWWLKDFSERGCRLGRKWEDILH